MTVWDDGHWSAQAVCGKDAPPDALFVEGAAQREARTLCASCPVQLRCLADALDSRMDFGVWGGMTERERRALLRRRPDVRSWRDELLGGTASAAATALVRAGRGGRAPRRAGDAALTSV